MTRTQSSSFDGPNLFQAIQQDRREQAAAEQATYDIEDVEVAMTLPQITEIANNNVEYGALMWLQNYLTIPHGRARHDKTFIATKAAVSFRTLDPTCKQQFHEGMCRARQAINDAIRINIEQDELVNA